MAGVACDLSRTNVILGVRNSWLDGLFQLPAEFTRESLVDVTQCVGNESELRASDNRER
jgi:hypothetical protein